MNGNGAARPWRVTRAGGRISTYRTRAARDRGARRLADTDQQPVRCEHWTAQHGWSPDMVGKQRLPAGGWVTGDGIVPPACQATADEIAVPSVPGYPGVCGNVPVVAGTGHCLLHQHVYRAGIAESRSRPQAIRKTDDDGLGVHTLAPGQTIRDLHDPCHRRRLRITDLTMAAEDLPDATAVMIQFAERLTGEPIPLPGLVWWRETDGSYRVDLEPGPEPGCPTIRVSLEIDNHYELYGVITSHVPVAHVPPPPPAADQAAFRRWVADHLTDPFAGTDRTGGDSWYQVTITGSSEPSLVGRTF